MKRIPFEGPEAGEVWDNLRQHGRLRENLELLRDSVRIKEMTPGAVRRDAEHRLMAFISTAAFGMEPQELGRYGTMYERYRRLSSWNDAINRLHLGSDDVLYELHTGEGTGTLELRLGYVAGYTSVMPVTELAYEDFTRTDMRFDEFGEGHIVRGGHSPNSQSHIYISGIVYFDSLRLPRRIRGRARIDALREDPDACGVMWRLFRHLAGLCPKLRLSRGAEGLSGTRVRTADGRELPKFTCWADSRGISADLAFHAGFDPKSDGGTPPSPPPAERKFILDLADFNATDTASERKAHILKSIKTIMRYQK